MKPDWMKLVALACAGILGAGCGGPPECKEIGDICTIAGTGAAGFNGDLPPHETDLYLPMDVLVGSDERVWFLDWNNHRLRVIEEDVVRTLAGNGELGDDVGLELESSFNHPTSLAFDPQGRIVIAAWHNSRVKRFDLGTEKVENICGNGKRTYTGENGPASEAGLDLPSAIAFDADGLMYIMDQANQMIRVVDENGIIRRFAGQCRIGICGEGEEPVKCPNSDRMACGFELNPNVCSQACDAGYGGDGGPALEALIAQPVGQAADPGGRLAFDSQGNLFFADTKNHRIRRISTDGTITTVAGNGLRGVSKDGPATQTPLNRPVDVEVGKDGRLYFTDTGNSCVRVIEADGTTRTIAGRCGEHGGTGDGEAASAALLDRPYGLSFDRHGNLFIADTQNGRIRKVLLAK